MDINSFQVGQRVRVVSSSGAVSTTGLISGIDTNESRSTYDIIYDILDKDLFGTDDEENCVNQNRIRALEDFESVDISTFSISQLKVNGNILFGLKDLINASKYYFKAIEKFAVLYDAVLGCNVVVLQHSELPKGVTCVDGIVSDVDDGAERTYDVILSNETELNQVKRSQFLVLPPDRENLLLIRSLYLNLARCDVKRSRKGWAVYNSSIAVSISEIIRSDFRDKGSAETDDVDRTQEGKDVELLLADALYFRAKALISASRPGLATSDFFALQTLDQSKRVTQLKTEIDSFRSKRAKDNQRLAKDIARWVDDVMSGKVKSTQNHLIGDIDVGEDCEDDVGLSAASAKSLDYGTTSVSCLRSEDARKDRQSFSPSIEEKEDIKSNITIEYSGNGPGKKINDRKFFILPIIFIVLAALLSLWFNL